MALMQHVVRELRSQRRRRRDRNEQLSGINGKGAIEIFWRDSHDGRRLSVQAKRSPHRVGSGVEAIAPETIANHHHGRVAGPVDCGAEHSATLRLHAEHGKIIGGYKLSEDALWFGVQTALERDIEWDAGLECGDGKMNEKLRDALHADQHPAIEYHLIRAERVEGETLVLKTTGALTINGKTRTTAFAVHVVLDPDGTARASGSVDILMTDFGVEPPTALLGVLKTYDKVTVNFEIRTTPLSSARASLP